MTKNDEMALKKKKFFPLKKNGPEWARNLNLFEHSKFKYSKARTNSKFETLKTHALKCGSQNQNKNREHQSIYRSILLQDK